MKRVATLVLRNNNLGLSYRGFESEFQVGCGNDQWAEYRAKHVATPVLRDNNLGLSYRGFESEFQVGCGNDNRELTDIYGF